MYYIIKYINHSNLLQFVSWNEYSVVAHISIIHMYIIMISYLMYALLFSTSNLRTHFNLLYVSKCTHMQLLCISIYLHIHLYLSLCVIIHYQKERKWCGYIAMNVSVCRYMFPSYLFSDVLAFPENKFCPSFKRKDSSR